MLIIIFVSFRITGTFVLSTVLHKEYDGWDLGVMFWLLAIPAGFYFLQPVTLVGYRVDNLVPHVACAYMVGRNLLDLLRHFAKLSPHTVAP